MTEFIPETADGTVDVEATLDTQDLAGHDLVFFERLADERESVIATHEDIDDEGQTVRIPAVDAPGKGYPKTGALADVDPVKASLLALALCGCAGAGYAYIRRSRNIAKAVDELEEAALGEADES